MTRPMVQADMPNFVCEAWLEEEPEESLRFAYGVPRKVYAWPGTCSVTNIETVDFLGRYASATTDWLERAQRLGCLFVLENLRKWPEEGRRRHELVTTETIKRTFGQDVAEQFNVAKVYW